MIFRLFSAAFFFVIFSSVAHAQSMSWGEDYARLVRGRELIDPLTDNSFGDELSLYDGSATFSATDISIPGNSDLPVAFRRSWDTQNHGLSQQVLGDWVIDVPNLNGTFVGTNGWPELRCSQASPPPGITVSNPPNYLVLQSWQYWNGYRLALPGSQGGMLLAKTSDPKLQLPATALGATSPWTTKDGWYFACLPAVQRGLGEGFIGFSPDGKKYTFDWMVEDKQRGMARRGVTPNYYFIIPRTMVRIYATRVEDRFGNWVRYEWSEDRLQRIHSNDGREITLSYDADRRLSSASANGRTWAYAYQTYAISQVDKHYLSEVVQPDGSRWRYDASRFVRRTVYKRGNIDALRDGEGFLIQGYGYCNFDRVIEGGGGAYVVTHPSGAQAEYAFTPMRHGRKNVPENCMDAGETPRGASNFYPLHHDALTLTSKKINGPGLPALNYQYIYSGLDPGYQVTADPVTNQHLNATPVPNFKTVKIVEPDGTEQIHVFGRDYGLNEGRLFRVETRKAGVLYQAVAHEYISEGDIPAQNFPNVVGSSLLVTDNSMMSAALRPTRSTTTTQDGESFNLVVNTFDAFARPVSTTQTNTLGYARTDTTEYHDDLNLWVLGQMKRRYNIDTGGTVEYETGYNALAQPILMKKFGKIQQVVSYWPDGMPMTFADGGGNTTLLGEYHRGIPRLIRYPATPEALNGATETADVDNNGWIKWAIDEVGAKTSYGYDAMGRLISTVYPPDDSVVWLPKVFEFRALTASDWRPSGITVGQWRHYEGHGNYAKFTYYDAMWRPVLVQEYDTSNVNPTIRYTRTAYDSNGRVNFQSYPVSDPATATAGIRSFYDALDRVTSVQQDSEHGVLTTVTDYLAGLKVRVTNPRNLQATTSFMAWDRPSYDLPIRSDQPESKVIEILRHPQFGWPLQLKQRSADNTLQQVRWYVYDGNAQLCKTIEPETGATVTGYDAANNPTWQAAGLTGGDYDSTDDCSYGDASNSGLVSNRSYDARNRIQSLDFPDGRGNQLWTYEKDNLPASVTAYNNPGSTTPVVTAYTYNKRRLLTGESSSQPGWYTWGIGYEYDPIGNLRWQSYPTGLSLDYAPNALGQPTGVRDQNDRFYASGASYYPTGALKQFSYGNGIVHTMTQNARQLPSRVTSSGGVNDFAYNYDVNANITIIWDLARGDNYSRWMTYDGLDRLTSAGSASFGGDAWHRYTYDALDNLKSWKLAGVKDYADYIYENSTHRLTSIRNTAGATVVGFGYDPQGNLNNKNGQGYDFDYGNRLRGVASKEYYRYDGLGRRVMNWRYPAGTSSFSQYSQSGQLMYQEDYHSAPTTASEHIYFAGSLIATRETKWGVSVAVKYQHTDALGSPVAVTNEVGAVIERNDYEPYGAIIGQPSRNGIGYTGHMMDGATGLTYMQQRYYDQSIGRFLSVDPVAARQKGDNFNRYAYAFNNPYRFADPDGRDGSPFSMARADARIRELEETDPKAARTAQIQGYSAATAILFGPLIAWKMGMTAWTSPIIATDIAVGAGEAAGVTGAAGASAFQGFKLFRNLGTPGDQAGGALRFALSTIKEIGYSGRLNYVVKPSGEVVVGRGGHSLLSGAGDVLAAGEVRFANGAVKSLNNASGHYQPTGDSARKAAESAFESAGFPSVGKYKEVK